MTVKIKVIGKDGQNWSIDKDRFYTEKALHELNFSTVKCSLNADIIFNVWYSYILKKKFLIFKQFKGKRKVVSAITNDPEDNNKNLIKYRKITDYWICANSKQKRFLLTQNIKENLIFINPFYVDENTFKNENFNKKELATILEIDFKQIENKFIVGSFQRDSRGNDLTKSKWHKNPELMIDILKNIDTNSFVLLLAGPRRHFIINQCKIHKIPYIFIGNESYISEEKDDVLVNNISQKKINLLYNLIDLYLVTSSSEGGPKAIIEALLTQTGILSTAVGFAPDLLNPDSICKDKDDFLCKINSFINNPDTLRESILKDYEKVSKINNFEAYKGRIKNIIETISNDR